MPLPATRVIHRDFSAHHEVTAEGAMTARGNITRRATTTGTLNTTTGVVTNIADTAIATDIPARIQAAPGALRPLLSGGQVVTQHVYLIQVPSGTLGVEVDDRFTVTESNDPNLTGVTLRISDVTYGSEGFTLDLTARDDLG